MAIKKTQLYSILWESCNILRGSMDASQYKNYVLTMLFLKYISDKVKSDSDIYFDLPEGCSFDDIIALKGKPNIGEEIQKKLHAIARANPRLDHIINEADFDDSAKLGSGKAKVDTLTSLISVFQKEFLDFSKNRAGDDDLIGDAYEYLMKNFAAESGKKKGQFYTPAEVSRLMARIIGIHKDKRPQISIYDPTCGSGSLLLRAKAEANVGVAIFGQELDGTTRGMAVMNMFLHGVDDPELEVGDTIEKPFFKNGNQLETFNYVVANPPFSQKGWIKGEIKTNDTYGRWGDSDNLPPIPPVGYEDYAFLLHIIKSLNSQGRGACILPNGVLFRGNEEEAVRRKIIEKRYIRGIISLPPNLFFGTGIPACIIIIDKAKTSTSKGIFMIDASTGFAKDGAKNRLREQDIRRVSDAWETLERLDANGQLSETEELIPHFARFVPYTEITNERNDCNLNVSRYITPVDTEIQQDLFAHLNLNGGLPVKDIDEGLSYLWHHCPSLKDELFAPLQKGYYSLAVDRKDIPNVIAFNTEFRKLSGFFSDTVEEWYKLVSRQMFALAPDCQPKKLIADWSESLLETLVEVDGLVDEYDVYDILLNYWNTSMQDDCYLISREGWVAELSCEQLTTDKKSKEVKFVAKKNPTFRDYTCDLLPVDIVVSRFFKKENEDVNRAEELVAQLKSEIEHLEEEYPEDLNDSLKDIKIKYQAATTPKPQYKEMEVLEEYLKIAGSNSIAKKQREELKVSHKKIFDKLAKIDKNTVKSRVALIKQYAELPEDTISIFKEYIELNNQLTVAKADLKQKITILTDLVVAKYPKLTESEIKDMVINDKWHTAIVGGAIDTAFSVSIDIEQQVIDLVDRYARRLSDIEESVRMLEKRVTDHLVKMSKGTLSELEYKKSELGLIPTDWETTSIESLISSMNDGPFGTKLKQEHYTSKREARIIQLGNIGDDGWNDSNIKYTTFEYAKTLSNYIVNPGEVLIAKMMPAGRAIICPSHEACFVQGSDAIRAKFKDEVNPLYFVYGTKSQEYLKLIGENTQGSTRQRIAITKYRSLPFILPPSDEQELIAEALHDIENLLRELQAKRDKYSAIRQGMMQQLLTGKIRLI